jgi:hypothetical protein
MYKKYLNPLNVTLLYLYFQNYIIMEEMKRMRNGEDSTQETRYFAGVKPFLKDFLCCFHFLLVVATKIS